jgi:hypothetical protein
MKLASIAIVLSSAFQAEAFLESFSNPILTLINKVNPNIKEFAQAQESALLNVRLDIDSESAGRFGISGLALELHGDRDADYPHPNLPGAQGPNPQLSSGAKSLTVLRQGSHIDMMGANKVPFSNGAFEMIWRRNASAGALILGFDAGEVRRNQVTLPMGRVYITFPVWTSETLQDLRDRKAVAEKTAKEALDRQRDEMAKMQQTNNLLAKAMHFRNCCKAAEDIDFSGYRSYQVMNLDVATVPLESDLHLCSLGTVWTKKDGMFGASDQILLGTALVAAGKRDEMEQKKIVAEPVLNTRP